MLWTLCHLSQISSNCYDSKIAHPEIVIGKARRSCNRYRLSPGQVGDLLADILGVFLTSLSEAQGITC